MIETVARDIARMARLWLARLLLRVADWCSRMARRLVTPEL
jgi:hypothetical protein